MIKVLFAAVVAVLFAACASQPKIIYIQKNAAFRPVLPNEKCVKCKELVKKHSDVRLPNGTVIKVCPGPYKAWVARQAQARKK